MRHMCRNMNDYAGAVDTSRVVARTRRAEIRGALEAHKDAIADHAGDDASSISSICDSDGGRYQEEMCDDLQNVDAFLDRSMDQGCDGDQYVKDALESTSVINWEYAR